VVIHFANYASLRCIIAQCVAKKIGISDFVSTKIIKKIVDAFKVKCPQCNSTILRGEYDNHFQKCLSLCKFGCNKLIAPVDQYNHEHNDCTHYTVDCPGKESFCDWKGARYQLQDHLKECQFHTFEPIISAFKLQILQQQQKQIDLLKIQVQQQQNDVNSLKTQLDTLNQKFNVLNSIPVQYSPPSTNKKKKTKAGK